MDSRPYPAESSSPSTLGQPQNDPFSDPYPQPHSRFERIEARTSTYPSSHSLPSSSDDRDQVPNRYRQQQQQQQLYPPHDQKQQMDVETSPYSHGGHPLNIDPATRPQHSISPHESPLSSRTGQTMNDSRRPYLTPSSALHTHRSSPQPQHTTHAFPSTNGPIPAGVEIVPESASVGGRVFTSQHPEEPLHVLSWLAQQQQRQQLQQHHYAHPSHQHQQQEEPLQEYQQEPHQSMGRDSPHHTITTGSQNRTLPSIQLEITDSDAVDRAQGRASLTKYSSVHHQYNNKDNTLDNDINNTTSLYNTSYSDDYPYRPRLDQNQNHERAYYYKDLPDEYQSDYHSDGRPYSTPHNSSHHHYTRHLQQHNQNQYQVQSQFESQDRCRLSESAEINHPESRLVAHPLSQQDPIQRQSTPYQQQSQSQWHQQEPNSTLPVSSHSSCPSPHPKQPEPDLDQPLPNTTNRTSIGRLPLLPSNGLPRLPGRMGDRNSTMHDSSYDSNQEDSEDFEEFNPGEHNYQYKFGTDLPNTVDLRSAIESCDALCKFALHYSKQPSSLHRDDLETLSPEMRANLQKIRFMNTTMLIGLQHVHQRPNEGEDAPTNSAQPGQAGRQERETSPVRFDSYGQPAHEIVHELAKAATSIFQLAIRIKAWVSMTPEQRELDEDINMIRGKRCLLMDSTLASATVDRHGNVKKDWTVVPAASSTSKSFYERQRDLDQQRPMLGQTQSQKQSHPQSQMKQGQSPANGYLSNRKMDSDNDDRLVKLGSNGSGIPFSRSHGGHSYQDNISCSPSSDSNISRASFDGNSRSQGYGKGGGSSRGGIADSSLNSRDSKNGDVPYQKYRKRAKRTQPPGRCLSCDSSDTPEWRRGPDGARTLCNACGLHYAKLLKRQNGMGSQQLSSGPPMKKGLPNIARMDQLQAITLPLRRRNESQSLDPSIRLKSESPSLDAGTSNSNQGELDTVVTTPAPDRPDPQTSSSHQQTTSDGAASVTAAIAATSLDNEPKDFVMKQEP